MIIKFNYKNIIWFLILFAFLYPRGFCEYYKSYKVIMTTWLYVSMLIITVYFAYQVITNRLKINKTLVFVSMYFGIMLIETIAIEGTISEGLQKIFVTPVLIMYFFIIKDKYLKENISIIGYILLLDTILNCTIFNPIILKKIMGIKYIENITFVGHVQMCAQIGILGIAIGYLLIMLDNKKRGIILIVFSIMTMIVSDAIASYLVVLLLVFFYIINNVLKWDALSKLSTKFIFIIGLIVQVIVIYIVVKYKYDFGARYYVWIDALKQMKGHYIIGYGVYGILLHTFWMQWNGSKGMNYAHNQVLQILMDGGIILLFAYLFMVLSLLKKYSSKVSIKYKNWFNSFLILFLVDGMCESVTEYNFFYIFLILVYCSNEIYKLINRSENINCVYD